MKEFDTPQFTVGQTVRTGDYSTSPHYRVIDVFYWTSTNTIRFVSQYKYTCADIYDPTNIKQFCYYEIQDASNKSEEQKFCEKFIGKIIKEMCIDSESLTITMTDDTEINIVACGDECAHIIFYDEDGK